MKKTLFSAVALSALMAQGAFAEMYVGAMSGVSKMGTKAHVSDDKGDTRYQFDSKKSGKGATGDLIIGYRHALKGSDVFVGVEGSIGLDSTRTKKNVKTNANVDIEEAVEDFGFGPVVIQEAVTVTQPLSAKVKTRKVGQASASVVVGKHFKAATVYGRLGVGASKYRTQVIERSGARKKFKKTALQVTPAIGIERNITENVKARAELAVTIDRFHKKKARHLAGNDHVNLKKIYSTSAKAGLVFTL